MSFPDELKYTKEHEWAKVDGSTVTIGITSHAQESLGDIVFVELPEDGREVSRGDTFGVVESVKAVSDLYSPISGTVTESNQTLNDDPSLLNQDAFENWIVKIDASQISEVDELMDAAAYTDFVSSL